MSKQANMKKLVKQLAVDAACGRHPLKESSDHLLRALREVAELVATEMGSDMHYNEATVEIKLRRALGSMKLAQHAVDKLVQEVTHAVGD